MTARTIRAMMITTTTTTAMAAMTPLESFFLVLGALYLRLNRRVRSSGPDKASVAGERAARAEPAERVKPVVRAAAGEARKRRPKKAKMRIVSGLIKVCILNEDLILPQPREAIESEKEKNLSYERF
jgi:hypothetical protein